MNVLCLSKRRYDLPFFTAFLCNIRAIPPIHINQPMSVICLFAWCCRMVLRFFDVLILWGLNFFLFFPTCHNIQYPHVNRISSLRTHFLFTCWFSRDYLHFDHFTGIYISYSMRSNYNVVCHNYQFYSYPAPTKKKSWEYFCVCSKENSRHIDTILSFAIFCLLFSVCLSEETNECPQLLHEMLKLDTNNRFSCISAALFCCCFEKCRFFTFGAHYKQNMDECDKEMAKKNKKAMRSEWYRANEIEGNREREWDRDRKTDRRERERARASQRDVEKRER